jgi:DNA-binding LacI/PurR family transcriptional regulator
MTRPPSSNRSRIRMKDVAERLGVSVSTVSLVLSGDTRIPEDTARRVLQTVKAMEYRPNLLARSLARRNSRTIAVILPEFALARNKPFYFEALAGIHAQTQSAGYKIIVEAANRVFLARRYYLRMLKEQSADGMLYMAATINDAFLRDVEREPFPFVTLTSYADGVDLPCARNDDREAARIAVKHLISLGHTKIGFIQGTMDMSYCRDRALGYEQAMKEAGLDIQPNWIQPGDLDLMLSSNAAAMLAAAGVTAILASSDVMAYGALRGLKTAGRRVPQEIAVVGIDDVEFAAWASPTLTTVRVHVGAMAELAAKYVIRRAQTPNIPKNPLTEIPLPELIVRESCGGAAS